MAKILIADDSIAVRIEVCKILRPEGFDVIEAVDGRETVELAKQHSDIKLFLLDYNMPVLNGLEAARELRGLPGYHDVPMAMLTTESSSVLKAQGKLFGIGVWIVKPINAKSFVMVAHKFTGT